MNVQNFNRNSMPKFGLPAKTNEAPQPNSPKITEKRASSSNDTFEIVGSAALTGLVCGLSANTLGAGWGALASVPVSGVGMAAYSYKTADKNGYENLAGLAGGVAGLVMGGVGAAGAAIGSFAGHPIIGGLVAGTLFGAGAAYFENR